MSGSSSARASKVDPQCAMWKIHEVRAAGRVFPTKAATGNVIATVGMAKDMADGATFASRLEVVEVGTDEDGDPKTSCVIAPVEGEPQERADQKHTQGRKPSKAEQTFIDAFAEVVITEGADIRVMGDGPLARAVDLQAVRTQFCRRYATGEADRKKRADTIGKGHLYLGFDYQYFNFTELDGQNLKTLPIAMPQTPRSSVSARLAAGAILRKKCPSSRPIPRPTIAPMTVAGIISVRRNTKPIFSPLIHGG